MHRIACGIPVLVSNAAMHGARLGDALSRTLVHRHDGARPWFAAAHAYLAKTGCTLEQHQEWHVWWLTDRLTQLAAAMLRAPYTPVPQPDRQSE